MSRFRLSTGVVVVPPPRIAATLSAMCLLSSFARLATVPLAVLPIQSVAPYPPSVKPGFFTVCTAAWFLLVIVGFVSASRECVTG